MIHAVESASICPTTWTFASEGSKSLHLEFHKRWQKRVGERWRKRWGETCDSIAKHLDSESRNEMMSLIFSLYGSKERREHCKAKHTFVVAGWGWTICINFISSQITTRSATRFHGPAINLCSSTYWTTSTTAAVAGGHDADRRLPSISKLCAARQPSDASMQRRRSIAKLPLCQWLIGKLRQAVCPSSLSSATAAPESSIG